MKLPGYILTGAFALVLAAIVAVWWGSPRSSESVRPVDHGSAADVGSEAQLASGASIDAHDAEEPPPAREWSAAARSLLSRLERRGDGGGVDLDALASNFQSAMVSLSGQERIELLKAMTRWFVAGGHDAHGFMDRLPAGRARMQFASEMLRELLPMGSPIAIEWLGGVRDKQDAERLHAQMGREWARADLESAVAWAMALPDGAAGAAAMEGVAFTWTQRDVDAAFEWAVAIEDVAVQDRVVAMMVKVMAIRNPDLAAQWATEIPASKESAASLNYAVQAWARRDVEGAASWLQSIEDPAHHATAMRAVAVGWAGVEPAAAADWVVAWDGVEQRSEILGAVVEKWGHADPEAAMRWLEGYQGDDGEWRDRMVRQLISTTDADDPAKAKSLMEQFGSDELKVIAQDAIDPTPEDHENKQ